MGNRFIGAKLPKKVKFMNEDIEINKLTVNQVLKIQELSKELEKSTSDRDGLDFLVAVLKMGVAEFSDLTNDELCDLPMDELSKLSQEIMKYAGLVKDSK